MDNINDDMEYMPEIYSLVDENGEESEFELIDEAYLDDNRYFALTPFIPEDEDGEDDEDKEQEVVILKVDKNEDGEDIMATIEDEQEYEMISQVFYDKFQDMMNEMELDLNIDEAESDQDIPQDD
ncbi:MAG: DUF1292 domain-containing protein [Oscillospiraceae bacterium]|nr:DUF1292 domain-containing protein [Oscillospiraceae bacterium]